MVPIVLGRPSEETFRRIATEAKLLELSYDDVGMTTRPSTAMASPFRFDRWTIDLGGDAETFEPACEALRTWQAHRGAGARVFPDAPLAIDETVVVALGFPGFTAIAPCRIVWVIDDADNFGFGYGTLCGHPERGEESFVVRRRSGRVTFEIVAASRPAGLLPRIGAPVTRLIQKRMANRYLHALKRVATHS